MLIGSMGLEYLPTWTVKIGHIQREMGGLIFLTMGTQNHEIWRFYTPNMGYNP